MEPPRNSGKMDLLMLTPSKRAQENVPNLHHQKRPSIQHFLKILFVGTKKTDAAPVATATAATPQLDTSQATKHSSQQSAQQANAAFYRMFRDSSFPSFHNPFSSPKDLIDPRHLQWQNIVTVDLGWWCLMDGTFLKDSFQGPMRKMFLGYGRLVQYVMCQTWFTISAWVACVRRIASVDC